MPYFGFLCHHTTFDCCIYSFCCWCSSRILRPFRIFLGIQTSYQSHSVYRWWFVATWSFSSHSSMPFYSHFSGIPSQTHAFVIFYVITLVHFYVHAEPYGHCCREFFRSHLRLTCTAAFNLGNRHCHWLVVTRTQNQLSLYHIGNTGSTCIYYAAYEMFANPALGFRQFWYLPRHGCFFYMHDVTGCFYSRYLP